MIDHNAIILRIIKSCEGDANKLTQAQITDECISRGGVNITDRKVRRIIEELIKHNYPIISTPKGGYFYQEKEEEGLECYRRLRKQGIRILFRARNVLRNSRQGQQRLFDINNQ